MFALIETSIPELIAHILLKKKITFTTKRGGFRLRFFGPRFKKRGPKLSKAQFFKNGA